MGKLGCDKMVITEGDDINYNDSSSSLLSFSTPEDSNGSSTHSSDLADDDASSSSSSGALFNLSDLLTHLPIKRGLSKYFDGKSESFTSLSSVQSIEDLAKKGHLYYFRSRKKPMNSCKCCGGGLTHDTKLYTLPKPTISKKIPAASRTRVGLSRTKNQVQKHSDEW